MGKIEMGIVGLGVMGRNLALNIVDKGFSVAGYDAWPDAIQRFKASHAEVHAFSDLAAFVASLKKPRKIILLVKAGEVTEQTIARLVPFLEPSDLIVDGGNEHFRTTERRAKAIEAKGILYFGMGISGGEKGARQGPSMMPGGDEEAYRELAPVLTKIAAQTKSGPCVTYIGPGGSGHYVKMVHNGIEYANMQIIAEAYDVLKTLGGLSNEELADTFEGFEKGELGSYLIEITNKIFRKKDPEGKGDLVDQILDSAGQKGTGAWTAEDAVEIGVAIPGIGAAVSARLLSSLKDERVLAAKTLSGKKPAKVAGQDRAELVEKVRAALYASTICSYAEGFYLIKIASEKRNWGVDLSEVARIWQGGCIIRAQLLEPIRKAFDTRKDLPNLMLDSKLCAELAKNEAPWRKLVALGISHGLPLPSMGASLAYYDSYRRERLPANLTQAQRDFFGAHGYRRIDRPGELHTEWEG